MNTKLFELLDTVQSMMDGGTEDKEAAEASVEKMSTAVMEHMDNGIKKIGFQFDGSEETEEVVGHIKNLMTCVLMIQYAQSKRILENGSFLKGNNQDVERVMEKMMSLLRDIKIMDAGMKTDAFELVASVAFFIGFSLGSQCEE